MDWDTLNAVVLSVGMAQFIASLIPIDFSRLGRDPAKAGFPLRHLLTGGHPLLLPLLFAIVYGLLRLKLAPDMVLFYAARAGGIGGIIFSVLSQLTLVKHWYRHIRKEKDVRGEG